MAKIRITESDIKKGVQGWPNECAVARAIQRIYNEPTASVGLEAIHLDSGSYMMPVEMRQWINEFDGDKKAVKPTTFNVPSLPSVRI